MEHRVRKVVLAYSGGLDTSIIIPWLKENYGCEVIAYTADIGQGDELTGLEEKALKTGASKIYIEDRREEFIRDFIYPTLKAGAIYEGRYLLGTSFARPLIAKHQVEVAEKEGADAVAHGCTGKGNDQVRFELTFKALNPKLRVIAPWREWSIRSREEAIRYAKEKKVPITATLTKIYSHDQNLWHLSSEGGELEDPWQSAPEVVYGLSVSPEQAPDRPTIITVDFEEGEPVALNSEKMSPVDLLIALNKIGGENAIGRIDMVEILWSSQEFGFIAPGEKFATGSSMMPNKKNPDAFESIRGKAGVIIGLLTGIMTLQKGVPVTYSRDLQDDKKIVFEALQLTSDCLNVFAGGLATCCFRADRMAGAIDASLFATDIADYLVRKGVPFRQAHHIVAQAVQHAEREAIQLNDLPLEFWKALHPGFDGEVMKCFDAEVSVELRNAIGGTALAQVKSQLRLAKKWLRKAIY